MAYFVPSLQISQEFTQIPIFVDSPLSALIIGPALVKNRITAIAMTGGSSSAGTGYTSAPTVTITDSTGVGATATATLGSGGAAGTVTSITIVKKGFNYSSTPTITFSGGGGTGAAAGAVTIDSTRTLLVDNSATIGAVNSDTEVIAAVGDIDSANPLAYGLHLALLNSNANTVYFAAIVTNNEAGYITALALAEKSNQYYGIVPLSNLTAVMADTIAHCNGMSNKTKAKWRTCWLNTINPNSGSAQSQIDSVITSLPTGGASSANVNAGPRRVHNVFPDTYYIDETTSVQGYFLAAALAGVRSGSVPHQSLTNTQVIGPYYLDKCVSTYTETQLDQLAAAGVWVVTQANKGGAAFTRQQLTGDNTNLNFSEDSITANVDSISYGLQAALAPFVGIYNITPATILKIRAAVDAELSYRLTGTFTNRAGNQLIGYTIVSVKQNTTFLDKVDVVVQLQVPYPMNFITVSLSV